jgi:hypothetical protein
LSTLATTNFLRMGHDTIAGRDRQEIGEDGGLFAVERIRNDEVIAGERLKAETSTPVFMSGTSESAYAWRSAPRTTKSSARSSRTMWPPPGRGPMNLAFDLDRAAER